ncbi:hypothetical protein CXB51_021873 [Gossypium anomalum]|uniref:TraB domain-containing protein n=1 Tax=Gossypium anomalum TaxID=47600 RepID=A0A8J5Y6H9_9ROSI|nr:hypothetical protein CXB51_021873 [Gossypium anomalum]
MIVRLCGLHQTATARLRFQSRYLAESTAKIGRTYPQLVDLAENGTLVLVEKRQFGPVPAWRTEFVEPEAIWLLGTTHVSPESASDVERVVRAVKPDNGVVETLQKQASSEWGSTALALRLLLALFSSKLSSDLNRPFGDEFRAARKASEEVGAQIVLGDRPIEITEQNYENDTFQLYEHLSFSYPSLLQPLVHERDTYLAWSLKRSKAVNKCKAVVGVIGKGHMNGFIYALVSDQGNLRFRDLAGRLPLKLSLMAGLNVFSKAWLETL